MPVSTRAKPSPASPTQNKSSAFQMTRAISAVRPHFPATPPVNTLPSSLFPVLPLAPCLRTQFPFLPSHPAIISISISPPRTLPSYPFSTSPLAPCLHTRFPFLPSHPAFIPVLHFSPRTLPSYPFSMSPTRCWSQLGQSVGLTTRPLVQSLHFSSRDLCLISRGVDGGDGGGGGGVVVVVVSSL
jgi:hypothetical protein